MLGWNWIGVRRPFKRPFETVSTRYSNYAIGTELAADMGIRDRRIRELQELEQIQLQSNVKLRDQLEELNKEKALAEELLKKELTELKVANGKHYWSFND